VNLTSDVRDVLGRSKILDDRVILPEALDRKLYLKVDKVLKAAGAKWSRKEKAHLFPSDMFSKSPAEILGLAIETGTIVDPKKDRQAFYTPPGLARLVAKAARLWPDLRVLEPSVGQGALVKAAMEGTPSLNFHCFEIDPATAADVSWSLPEVTIETCDFLEVAPFNVDRVLMNPPFSGNQDVRHITHALRFLVDGGYLVSILPAGTVDANSRLRIRREFWELIEAQERHWVYDVPEGAFAYSGTKVKTKILVVRKALGYTSAKSGGAA